VNGGQGGPLQAGPLARVDQPLELADPAKRSGPHKRQRSSRSATSAGRVLCVLTAVTALVITVRDYGLKESFSGHTSYLAQHAGDQASVFTRGLDHPDTGRDSFHITIVIVITQTIPTFAIPHRGGQQTCPYGGPRHRLGAVSASC
jgi:hypothetical protein